MLELFLIGWGTAFATGIGAVPVFMLGRRAERLQPALLGLAAGVMGVAAVAGLLLPAIDNGSGSAVAGGLAIGVLFLLAARRYLVPVAAEHRARAEGTSILTFVVLLVHSLPEGLALGTAYASTEEGLALFIVIAIAIQNIPEGTSIAIPMQAAGHSPREQFWAAVLSSAPQPFGAVLAYALVDSITDLLPLSFAFAAGAMLALVVIELLPEALRLQARDAVLGTLAGGAVMLALSAWLGV